MTAFGICIEISTFTVKGQEFGDDISLYDI